MPTILTDDLFVARISSAFLRSVILETIQKFETLDTKDYFYENKKDIAEPECEYKLIPFLKKNHRWWKSVYTYSFSYTRGFLYQITGTCWIHCVINLIILSPLSNEIENLLHMKEAENMTFFEIASAGRDKSVCELLFALLKNMLLQNTFPKPSDGNILLPIAARIKGLVFKDDENYFRTTIMEMV